MNNTQEIRRLQDKNALSVPKHVAIIMDGNGRWAKQQGKMRLFGHKAGMESVRCCIESAANSGVEELTLFAFSSENWRRPENEVSGLMSLFEWVLTNDVKKLHKNNVCLKVVGDASRFSLALQKAITNAQTLTQNNTGLKLNLAVNYGGRWDIIQSLNKIIEKNKENITALELTEDLITENLAVPTEVDLLIRTGGEQRISNFLLWQVAYSEMYVTQRLWPDFREEDFKEALAFYSSRERRFGCIGEQIRGEVIDNVTNSEER